MKNIKFKLIVISTLFIVACKSDNKTQSTFSYQSSSTASKTYKEGKKVYLNNCIACHLPNGKGVPKAFPPLANSDFLMKKREASIHAIKFGIQGEITVNNEVYNNVMSPLGLTNKEIADVMNYITNSWNNTNDNEITETEVSKIQQ